MKFKPAHSDFEAFPVVDFTGMLDKPVSFSNTYEELVRGMRNMDFRRNIGDSIIKEVYVRAYNHTSQIFAGYNRLAYISMMYAEEVKRHFLRSILDEEWSHKYLVGLMTCDMSGRGPVHIREPFLIVGADTETDAEDKYNSLVPLTTYYPGHIIARWNEKDGWQLCSAHISEKKMNDLIDYCQGSENI